MTNSYPFTVFGDEFKGKRVLVTGGTKGIGEAILRRFELSGALVATTARSEPAAGQARALFIKADIGTARGVQNVFDSAKVGWARRLGEQCRRNTLVGESLLSCCLAAQKGGPLIQRYNSSLLGTITSQYANVIL